MAKTNKEFRSDLAKEMRDKRKERDAQLEQIEKSQFSEWLKENMRKEIKENFEREIDEMKNRPWYEEARKTHLDEIKSKSNVKKAKAEKERLQKESEDQTEWTKEKSVKIPQKLSDYRKAWKEKLKTLDDDVKERIIKAVDKIPVKVETDNDWSRLIEFELGGKTWRILDPRLKIYTDKYKSIDQGYDLITGAYIDCYYVKLPWMTTSWDGEMLDNNLDKYVKEKEKEWLNIATLEDMQELLRELWEEADLDNESSLKYWWSDARSNQIAMLMYLTGMDWDYWLEEEYEHNFHFLVCSRDSRYILIAEYENDAANLCMMSCE